MKKIYCVAGGTGGHINAALAMGEAFKDQFNVHYLSGTRYLDLQLFKGQQVNHLASRPLRTKNPLKLMLNLFLNGLVFLKIFLMYLFNRPAFVLGAGGYICGPTLMAAKLQFIPVFVIEQNAVAGVTNKILSKFANLIFTNFKQTKGIVNSSKVIPAGNPIRSSIQQCDNLLGGKLKILIFGGSLGAEQINGSIKLLLNKGELKGYEITHQVGKGHLDESLNHIEGYKQLEYIEDMQAEYAKCNVIISRAGASTVSELRVVKKPAIIIPFPKATDNHQYHNALELKEENGFFVDVLDHSLIGENLAKEVLKSLNNIQENSHFYRNEVDISDASQRIKTEILNYVRN